MVEEYVCSLNEASLKKAQDELNEDPANRMGAVETLRQWVKDQPHLEYPTDNHSMLQMLRYAKYSQLRARETIENYCTMKTEHPSWFNNFDVTDKWFLKLMKDGIFFPLPGTNKDGCKVLMYRVGALKTSEWKGHKAELSRAMYTMAHYITHDENVQVNGMIYFSDHTGATMAHHMFWSMDEMKTMMKAWQKCFPGRYKRFDEYNIGPVFDAMMEMVKPFINKKFQDRMVTHGSNMENVYKVYPKEMFPIEYLPDDYTGPNAGTIQSLVENTINDIQKPEMAEYLKYVSDPKWKMDKEKKPEDIPQASFRKLNVD